MQQQTTNCEKQATKKQGTESWPIECVMLSVSYISAKCKTKAETLLYNITRILNTNNTADINFTLGGKNNKELKTLCS